VRKDNESDTAVGTGVAIVRVEPLGVSIEVARGETLMAAAERQGYRWPTICHGQALCTTCFIEDSEAFEPPDQLELTGLEMFSGRSYYRGRALRLACQARPFADTVVFKRGVRRFAPHE
jgi:ferredoxin, 2Fe-2S